MAWIKEEYADEVAVVTTWIAVFLPWSASYTTEAHRQSWIVFIRFALFDLQVRFPTEVTLGGQVSDLGIPEILAEQYGGVGLLGNVHLVFPPLRLDDVGGTEALAYGLWVVAALFLFGAFALSIAMYLREEAVSARLPVDFVKLTSVVVGLFAILLAGASLAFAMADRAYGVPLPIGVIVMAAIAIALWRAERRGDAE